MPIEKTPIRAAVLDLYNNEPNQGMRCIQELLTEADGAYFDQPLTFDVFNVRADGALPDLSYDLYISSGGPGSPFEGIGTDWEHAYFEWLQAVYDHNRFAAPEQRKHVLFICHSFQMMCRHFGVAQVTKRKTQSFGIMPVHPTEPGLKDELFEGLTDPFWAADFRGWQVVQPDWETIDTLGAAILAIEKERPHVPLERAIMGLRISPELVGVQFHPEADPAGMSLHFRQPERKAFIVDHHGEAKYERILHRLEDPNFVKRTHDRVIPNFLRAAIGALRADLSLA